MAPSQHDIEVLQRRLEQLEKENEELEKEKKEAVEAAERRAQKAEEDKQKAEERAIRAEQERDQTNTTFQEYLHLCHIHLFNTLSVQLNKTLSSLHFQGRRFHQL